MISLHDMENLGGRHIQLEFLGSRICDAPKHSEKRPANQPILGTVNLDVVFQPLG